MGNAKRRLAARTVKAGAPQMTSEEMKTALNREVSERISKASEEIDAVLEKYQVAFSPEVILSQGTIRAMVRILPRV